MLENSFYERKNHLSNLICDDYYKNLVALRNIVNTACDQYFQKLKAPKVDLFLITRGVSSPAGRGSDSKPIPFRFGRQNVYLVDSSQFGLEPIVMNSCEMAYCYLPSFRGETPDKWHLNQFYHCEAEIQGDYKKAMQIAEGMVKFIIKKVLIAYKNKDIRFEKHNFDQMEYILKNDFIQISFDEVDKLFKKHKLESLIERKPYGRMITKKGELKLTELLTKNKNLIWITHYDRDMVAFYQKPDPHNSNRVLCADLIFPSINGSLGGEDMGLGQRQDKAKEIIESMKRQRIPNPNAYKWYIDLRKHKKYKPTSGFGMGIERFLAWILCVKSINDVVLYPTLINEKISN
jgi:asparaginyl-tRNA synthetase